MNEEGSRLLFEYLGRKPTDEKEEIAGGKLSEILGGLPLAIATIAGYINESGMPIAQFLDEMKSSSKAWQIGSLSAIQQYEKSLETVFEIALKELPEEAKTLLNILCLLNPDYISEDLFITDKGEAPTYRKEE